MAQGEWVATGETVDDDTFSRLVAARGPTAKRGQRSKIDPPTAPRPMSSEDWTATGEVVDGDTLRLAGDRNGRVSGFDAWEGDQLGYRPGRGPVNIGQQSSNALDGFVTPDTDVRGIGKETFNRPVVIARNGEFDAALPMLWQGHGLAAPEYLEDDPVRRAEYLEAERLGRLNNQGGHATQHLAPYVYRKADRWNLKLRPDEQVAFTNELPELRPEFQRLTDEEERDFFGFLASQSGNRDFSQADLDAYWKSKGRQASEMAAPEFLEGIRTGDKIGHIDYSGWDSATLADFKKQNAFAGMRREVQEAYGAMLSSPDATPEALAQFAEVNGMTFDPRDVAAFFDARREGRTAPIPLPLINPGDGRTGAAARGFGDPLGFIDELGGVVDAIGGTPYRESVWNSDRSFGDIYENNLRQNRAIIDYDETNHPYARLAGQFVSGAAIPGSIGVRGVAGYAKAGAAVGGVYGFGSADGNFSQRLANVPVNAAVGAVAAGVLGKGIDLAAPLVRSGVRRLTGVTRETPNGSELSEGWSVVGQADEAETARIARSFVANMDADPEPALVGPRVVDRIDVEANRTRPLADGPSPAAMEAMAARIQPQDVLPRQASEVTSLDEASRINEGLYPEVPAPRERDYLEPRQFPSRTNPDSTINRKGPADLVTFARTHGIRDEGGELTAAGISNAARKGEDFAGGESRLGRLVDNDNGISVEDAAQRAWNEGYFPELDTPPMPQQYLAALDDTYRGVGRRFRPEDEAEIQAFEGARDQRLAVERARQEGAPLVDDVGQPATYEDAVANTPPALNPDEWNPETISRVGNINLEKLNSSDDIGRALKVANDIGGGFNEARRGVITHAENKALAERLGMTVDDLLSRRRGQAFNAEEALASKMLLDKAGLEWVQSARRLARAGDNPGSELVADFELKKVRLVAVQEHVAAMTSEAGRALQSFRQAASATSVPGRLWDSMIAAGGGQANIKKQAQDLIDIIDLIPDPSDVNKFAQLANKPKLRDKLTELWYSHLLWGPQTHAVNILSNMITAVQQIPEHAIAAGIGGARRVVSRADVERVTATEVGRRAVALISGTKKGLQAAKRAAQTGESYDLISKVEDQGFEAISGLKGKIIRTPLKALTIEDEFFKAVSRQMEIDGLAVRAARKDGLRGAALGRRADELSANPTDEMVEKSFEYARYNTFQRAIGSEELAGHLMRWTQKNRWAKLFLPFIRTPTNIVKYAAERSPLAPLVKSWRDDFKAGGERRDLAAAKVIFGSGIAAVVADYAEQGLITGSAPSDDNKRRLLMSRGWQPYSIKIGDTYYSYKRLDPLSSLLGTVADMTTASENLTQNQAEQKATFLVASILGNLSSKTWLSGISDLVEVFSDPERYSQGFINRLGGTIAMAPGMAQISRTIDPTMREARNLPDTIQSRTPGMSSSLFPKRDVWGRVIENEGGVGPDLITPIWTSKERPDAVTDEVLRVGASVGAPGRKISDSKELTDEQFDKYQAVAGPLSKAWVGELVKMPQYGRLDIEGQAAAIEKVVTSARRHAKAYVISGKPLPTKNPAPKRQRRNRGDRRQAQPAAGDSGNWVAVE